MLNLFPIQFLALLAYFILRVITGLVLLWLAKRHFQFRHELSTILVLPIFPFGKITVTILIITEIIAGALLTLGAFTQIGALLLILLSLDMLLFRQKFQHQTLPNKLTYLLLLAIGLSLFITGAGAFAFDLPI